MLWIAGIYLACVFALVWAMLNAPEGYEDETGFHYGSPSE